MILADTSVWVDHLRQTNLRLLHMLDEGNVLTHPMVIGDLAVGNLRDRDVFLFSMQQLFRTVVATDVEVLTFILRFRLFGLGIGYVDCHLLAAVMLTPGATLCTRDMRLSQVAGHIGIAVE